MPMESPSDGQQNSPQKGYGWILAAFFIVGETAGSGLVAMPRAILNTGLIGGIILLCVICLMLGYTAHQLGQNWLLMQRRWPKYSNEACRDVYPEMARRALGIRAKIFSQIAIYTTLFAAVSVLSLLAAKNFSQILAVFHIRVHFCLILLAVALFIWPFQLLRSPAHFWQVSIIAAVSTSFAVVLIIIGTFLDLPQCFYEESTKTTPDITQFSLGFGTIVFAYGGHPGFPVLQHDMKNPALFTRAVVCSYTLMFLLYAPVSLISFHVYGNNLSDSVISSIQTPLLRNIINLMITIHVLFSILIIGNPLNQGAEHVLKIKDELGLGRVVVRSAIFWSAIFVALTFPNFGLFLDLVGSSTMTLLAMILPGLFTLYLEAGEQLEKERQKTNSGNVTNEEIPSFISVLRVTHKGKLLVNFIIIALGIVCGVTATINAMMQMFDSSLATPCYVQLYNGVTEASFASLRCCGRFGNVTFDHTCDITLSVV